MQRVLLILLLLTLHRTHVSGQANEREFSTTELQSDFRILRERYEENLATLYLYVAKDRLDSIFDSLYAGLKPMSAQEFYSYITPLLSIINDGHSNIFPAKSQTAFDDKHSVFFPFNIYWTAGKMYVLEKFSTDKNTQAGAEILSINGLSVKEILDYLLIRQVRDGYNENYALWIINKYFSEIRSVAGITDTSQILKSDSGKMTAYYNPRKKVYKGKLFVLINGGSFSNTVAFCSRIEFYRRGIFVGDETGGNNVVFSGVFGLKGKSILSNTKIICDNSNHSIVMADINDNNGHGVIPDFIITPSVDDIIHQNDVVLNFALNSIIKK